ncbi:MAG: hypothetical protein JWO36_601 [Myxococcales bacterium]|nr:hypothetical protein [Myxococcales bacterium]
MLLVLLATACGRVGFDDQHGPDAGTVFGHVALAAGGDARRVVAASPSLDVLFALFGDNRIVRSIDRGATFTDCGPISDVVNDLVAKQDGSVYVAAAGDVFESHDDCATFSANGLGSYWTAIAADGSDLWAGTAPGLRRRRLGTWQPIVIPLSAAVVTKILVGASYLVATNRGIVRSVDGITWVTANTGLAGLEVLDLASVPGRVYAATNAGLHVSLDGGVSWSRLSNEWGDVVAADPGDPAVVGRWWYSGFATTTDAGTNWSLDVRSPEMDRSRISDVLFDPAGSGAMIVATGRGLFIADHVGLPFRQLGALDAWTIHALVVSNGDQFLGTSAGLLRSSDGVTYTVHDPGSPVHSLVRNVLAPAERPGTVYAAGLSLARSDDRGDHFSDAYVPTLSDGYVVRDVVSTGGVLFASTDARVLSSPDGLTWSARGLAAQWTTRIFAIAGTPVRLLVATDAGVLYSSDGGTTFTSTNLPSESYAFAVLPEGTLVAGTLDGVYASPTGATWQRRGLTGMSVRALAQVNGTLVATQIDRVSYSTDGGMTFSDVPGFTGRNPISLAVDPHGALLVGTSGYGLYRLTLP